MPDSARSSSGLGSSYAKLWRTYGTSADPANTLLGSFAQFFSDMLGTHVSKGLDERAHQGLHTGGIPFGYESCWVKEHGERRLVCEVEHPGGLQLVDAEAAAVKKLFELYATGTATLNSLAEWL